MLGNVWGEYHGLGLMLTGVGMVKGGLRVFGKLKIYMLHKGICCGTPGKYHLTGQDVKPM